MPVIFDPDEDPRALDVATIPNKALEVGLSAQAIYALAVLARFRNHETGWTAMTHDQLAVGIGHRADAKDRSYLVSLIRSLRDTGIIEYRQSRRGQPSQFKIIYDMLDLDIETSSRGEAV